MKILLIGNYENSQETSMLIYVNQLSKIFTENNHQVKVIRPTPILGKLKNSSTGIGKWLGYIDKYLLFIPKLKKESKSADIIHICDHSNSIYSKYIQNKPYVITCHDVFAIRSALEMIEENKVSRSGKILQKWILNGLKRSKNIVCVSSNTKKELESILDKSKRNISVIYNCLNYDYKNLSENEITNGLKKLSLNPNEKYFFHLGGNHWYKNRIGVIKIFNEIQKKDQYQNTKLILAGVEWTEEMRELISKYKLENKVIELIKPSNEDINTLYSGCLAFLFPSLTEGFGWPIIEAQASGALVITNKKEPMIEVGADSVIYIDPSNVKEASNIIEQEILNKSIYLEKNKNNLSRFSKEMILRQFEEKYIDIIKGYSND